MIGQHHKSRQVLIFRTEGITYPWVSYALGSENEDLPTFVVLPDHRGFASNGPKNWGSAFLPTHTQGTTIFPQRARCGKIVVPCVCVGKKALPQFLGPFEANPR